MTYIEQTTRRSDEEIAQRVAAVEAYERFSVFSFPLASETHMMNVLNADGIQVTSKDGSVYFGTVEDWDDSRYYVNLR